MAMEPGDAELNDGVVTLRPLQLDDAADHLAGEDAELVRWLSGGPGTEDTVRACVERAQQMWANHGPIFTFAIRSSACDSLAGTIDVQLGQPAYRPGQANLAYGLYPKWRGRGLATRAVNLALEFLRSQAGVNSALIRVEPGNASSVFVAMRAGFTLVAHSTETADGHDWFEHEINPTTPHATVGGSRVSRPG